MVKKLALIDKYKFVKSAFNKDFKTFVQYIAGLEATRFNIGIHFLRILLFV